MSECAHYGIQMWGWGLFVGINGGILIAEWKAGRDKKKQPPLSEDKPTEGQ